jgi:hypothetical protein
MTDDMEKEYAKFRQRQMESMFPVPPDWATDTFMGLVILVLAFAHIFLIWELCEKGILHLVVAFGITCWLVGKAVRKWVMYD